MYSHKDCSTTNTRRPLFDYQTPHDQLIRELLDERAYSLDTLRINNGSDYNQRRYNSQQSFYDYSAYGELEPEQLMPPESYDSNLIFDEECSQGDFRNLPVVNPKTCTTRLQKKPYVAPKPCNSCSCN